MDAVTKYIGLGSYAEWSEDKRIEFLTHELSGRRPLVPWEMPCAPVESCSLLSRLLILVCVCQDDREVLDTFRTAARMGTDMLGTYVISMASKTSDVLLVLLFAREADVPLGSFKVIMTT